MAYACINGGIQKINIVSPTGEIYDTVEYIAPDAPYVIKNAAAGNWRIEIVALSENDAKEILENSIMPADSVNEIGHKTNASMLLVDDDVFSTHVGLIIIEKPTKVLSDGTIYTTNPSIIKDLLKDEANVIVHKDGSLYALGTPLTEGTHSITLVRRINGYDSDITNITIVVDTSAPEVEYLNERITNENAIYLLARCTEDVVRVIVDGEDLRISEEHKFGKCLELELGKNEFDVTLIDRCGNVTNDTVVLERIETVA